MSDHPRLEGRPLAIAFELWGKGWRTDKIAKRLRVQEAAVYNSVFHAYATDATVVPFRKDVPRQSTPLFAVPSRKKNAVRDGMKRCSSCQSVLEANTENFQRDKQSRDGLTGWCKPCRSTGRKANYWNNREKNKTRNGRYSAKGGAS